MARSPRLREVGALPTQHPALEDQAAVGQPSRAVLRPATPADRRGRRTQVHVRDRGDLPRVSQDRGSSPGLGLGTPIRDKPDQRRRRRAAAPGHPEPRVNNGARPPRSRAHQGTENVPTPLRWKAAHRIALADVAAEAGRFGHEFRYSLDLEFIDWVLQLDKDTLFYDLQDRATRDEIRSWFRFSASEAENSPDGLWSRTFGLPGSLLRF